MNIDEIREITEKAKKRQDVKTQKLAQQRKEQEIAEQKEMARRLITNIPSRMKIAAGKGESCLQLIDRFYGRADNGKLIGGNVFEQKILDWCEKEGVPVRTGWDSEMGEGGHSYLIADWSNNERM